MRSSAAIINGLGLYLLALGMMMLSTPPGVTREAVEIETADGRPGLGTLWNPADAPKAVMVMGHGITSNRAVMATLAKAFAANGYETLAFDFFGHGHSREPFDWNATHLQVDAWVEWARAEYPELPLAYLGHSMGGFAGSRALAESGDGIPFVSLGARPGRDGHWPAGPILIALGRFEQLFSPAQAHESAAQAPAGNASVLVSPWSDHALETWDPVLIGGIVDWVDGALDLPQDSVFPWGRWLLVVLSVPLGMTGIVLLAHGITANIARPPTDGPTRIVKRKWSVNPYRLTARLLGARGHASRPIAGGFVQAIPRGLLFAVLCVVPLSFLLTNDMFVSRLDHPERFQWWVMASALFAILFLLDAYAIESVPHRTAWRRFLVTALTRVLPILALSLVLQLPVTGMAFFGMMLGIFAFLALMLAIIHALATKASNDYRSAAIASAVVFAWVIGYWFPLSG